MAPMAPLKPIEDRDHCAVCTGYSDARRGTLGGASYVEVARPGWREDYQAGVRLFFTKGPTAKHPGTKVPIVPAPEPSHVPAIGTPAG